MLWLTPLAKAQAGLNDQWIAFERAGAPNSNLQCFFSRNVGISAGYLAITARAEATNCSSFDLQSASYPYTSGFVAMRRFNFLYGTVAVRAKFGGGGRTGAWPIVWMADASCQASDPTGTDDDCNEQEIDVAEILNGNFTQVNQQIHVDRFKHEDGCKAPTSDVSRDFHVYQLDWFPGSLVFKIDGVVTCTVIRSYVPASPMYLKISTFVGGYGGPVDNTSLPWTTLIDYVKVTRGSDLIFNDGFGPELADQPVAITTPLSSPDHEKRSLRTPIITACLVIIAVVAAYQVCGWKRQGGTS
ncbi:MAG: glycoside hydrolase family 16 protein [Acidobacteriia bacterium]|nr:glycoside hydrolase family 16 protein [Terriglobia bacterium]